MFFSEVSPQIKKNGGVRQRLDAAAAANDDWEGRCRQTPYPSVKNCGLLFVKEAARPLAPSTNHHIAPKG